jgi:hypothetical protein
MSNLKGDLAALFEFRIFMSNYLKHARSKHKNVYDNILKNTEFRAAYTLFEIRFTKLYDEYYKHEEEINKFQKPDPMESLDQFDISGSNEALYKFMCMADVEVANQLFELKDGKYVFNYDTATLNEIKKQYNDFCKQLKSITKSPLTLFMSNRNAYEKFVKKEYEAVKNELDVLRIKELNESNYRNYLKKFRS